MYKSFANELEAQIGISDPRLMSPGMRQFLERLRGLDISNESAHRQIFINLTFDDTRDPDLIDVLINDLDPINVDWIKTISQSILFDVVGDYQSKLVNKYREHGFEIKHFCFPYSQIMPHSDYIQFFNQKFLDRLNYGIKMTKCLDLPKKKISKKRKII